MSENDTIAAIATAPGLSGIGVVRLSGPWLGPIVAGLVGKPLPPRVAVLSGFRDAHGETIDQGLALFFPAPHSYTGEDVLELQGHGGPVVLQQLLKRCLELGARTAMPGEFTQRAYLNDKLDLAQAESVADLICAATAEAARGALRSLQGVFSLKIEELVRGLIELRTRVEATLDFPDEEVDFLKQTDADSRLAMLRIQLQEVLSASQQGSLLRDGVQVVLAGQPNVGKSSLLNRLAGEELAIVTEIPGTTRDVIRQSISVEGVPVHIIDTAGLREAREPVERLGIERTWAAIEKADLLLLLMDATQGESEADQEIRKRLPSDLPCIKVMNKIDLLAGRPAQTGQHDLNTVWLSAKTGMGIDRLRKSLLGMAGWQGSGEGLFMARERHVHALGRARAHLESAIRQGRHPELFAEELRLAQESLGTITGAFTSDDLLGEIFSRFCIGK
ncbi:MAG TPA: tRNA uridine-5-carboxymethylaminomethyl(34) synthesis GTPase MnmE [Burkholderiales bacterium]|nr:tRNA uridine-5-carboxymethylaminomethyl(34) synthesis GTPase MnmE [Burkholderiales bacterium]